MKKDLKKVERLMLNIGKLQATHLNIEINRQIDWVKMEELYSNLKITLEVLQEHS